MKEHSNLRVPRPILPWIKIYVGDFLRDTHGMGLADRGALFAIIMFYWTHAHIPEDRQRLATIAMCSLEEWDTVAESVLTTFQRMRGKLDINWSESLDRTEKNAAKTRA